MELEVSQGEIRRPEPGSVTLLDDVTGTGHRTRAIGGEDVRGVFLQLPA